MVWWRKPYGGLDGHGIFPKGRCGGSPESIEVSSLGKLRVFSKSPFGALGLSSHHGIKQASFFVHIFRAWNALYCFDGISDVNMKNM
jgi:hypothetical protein